MRYRTASKLAFLCLLFVAALPMVAVGQDETITDNVPVSEKSQAELSKELIQAEKDFYALYNQLNDDKDYDVRCFYEKTTGTNIKTHVCRARFVTKAYEKHARRNRNDLSRMANQDSIPIPPEKTARYQEILETLITANPDLQAALARYNTAQVRLLEKRGQDSGN